MHLTTMLMTFLAGSTLALPSSSHVLHEKRGEVGARNLVKKSAAPARHVMSMKVALAQESLHEIPELLDDVSNPHSPNFGKHWTGDELARKFAPSAQSISAVRNWLTAAGMKARLSANRHWVEFDASVEDVERLLKTKYHVYGSEDARKGEQLGCDDYSVPGHVSAHVDFIIPTVSMLELPAKGARPTKREVEAKLLNYQRPAFKPLGVDGAEGAEAPAPDVQNSPPSIASCALGATPDCIKTMYGIPKGKTASKGNELGIYESQDYYDQEDLDAFWLKYAPEIEHGTGPILNSIDGGLGPQNATISPSASGGGVAGESILDLQVAYPLVHPQGIRVLQVDDPTTVHSSKRGHFNSLLDALDADYCSFMGGDNSTMDFPYPNNAPSGYNGTKMCGTFTPPTVISISYGYAETTFSPAYLRRQCLEFAKLAMAGTTVVVSSGDSGVSAPFCANPIMDVATPEFPASCPYVTTVGATMIDKTAKDLTADGAEIVGVDTQAEFKSGSGFSNVFDAPPWQKEAVSRYLANKSALNSTLPMNPGENFNAKGRAYPDLAALGTNVTTITNGRTFIADGTSASAPLIASLITLINEERMCAGKGPVGFINPTLYASRGDAKVFRDITKGDNHGCGMGGFTATKGWDAVSGWGTPRYQGLRDLLFKLP